MSRAAAVKARREPSPEQWRRGRPLPDSAARVALDIDGVLGGYLDALARMAWGRTLPEPSSYQVWTDPAWPVDDEQAFMRIHGEAVRRGLYASEECDPGMAWLSQRLVTGDTPMRLDVVTSRRDDGGAVTRDWLRRHRIAYDDLVHVDRPTDKALLGYDAVIDDDPAVLAAVRCMGELAVAPPRRWVQGLGFVTCGGGMAMEAMIRTLIGA